MCEVSFITNWKAFAEQWIWIISNKLQLNIKQNNKGGKGRDREGEKRKKPMRKNKKENNLLLSRSSILWFQRIDMGTLPPFILIFFFFRKKTTRKSPCQCYFLHLHLLFLVFLCIALLVSWLVVLHSRTAQTDVGQLYSNLLLLVWNETVNSSRLRPHASYFVSAQNGPGPFVNMSVIEAMNENKGSI